MKFPQVLFSQSPSSKAMPPLGAEQSDELCMIFT
jgi:hypothetical protein